MRGPGLTPTLVERESPGPCRRAVPPTPAPTIMLRAVSDKSTARAGARPGRRGRWKPSAPCRFPSRRLARRRLSLAGGCPAPAQLGFGLQPVIQITPVRTSGPLPYEIGALPDPRLGSLRHCRALQRLSMDDPSERWWRTIIRQPPRRTRYAEPVPGSPPSFGRLRAARKPIPRRASKRARRAPAAARHLTIRQLAFVVLLTLRETLPISIPSTWPRPRLPMTMRSILFRSA